MGYHINPALREKLATMVAVIAPANTAVAPQESRIAGPGRYFGADYTANPLHLRRRPPRDEIE